MPVRLLFPVLLLVPAAAFGGFTEEWVRRQGNQVRPADERNHFSLCGVDAQGNVYVAGQITEELPRRIAMHVSKYSSAGVLQWNRSFAADPTFDEEYRPAGLVVLPDGRMFVAAESYDRYLRSATEIKALSTSGADLWSYRYANSSELPERFMDLPTDIVTDGIHLYVGLASARVDPENFAPMIIKLDLQGQEAWKMHYDQPGSQKLYDMAIHNGAIYGGGGAYNETYDYVFKVNAASGALDYWTLVGKDSNAGK